MTLSRGRSFIKTFTYNVWDEIEKTTETYGTTTRTITQTYDSAGRALTSETASTIDTSLPKVTNEYNSETGALEKQSTTVGGKTKTITSRYNTLVQLTKAMTVSRASMTARAPRPTRTTPPQAP